MAKPNSLPFVERPWCRIDEAADATTLSRSLIYRAIQAGEIRSKVVKRARLISVPSLLAYIDPRPDEPVPYETALGVQTTGTQSRVRKARPRIAAVPSAASRARREES